VDVAEAPLPERVPHAVYVVYRLASVAHHTTFEVPGHSTRLVNCQTLPPVVVIVTTEPHVIVEPSDVPEIALGKEES